MYVLFDLDGTLIETDKANFLAYHKATLEVCGINISMTNGRFTRENLSLYHDINENEIAEIVKRKQKYFLGFVDETRPLPTLSILQHLNDTHNILLTYCSACRLLPILNHYGIMHLFSQVYYKECYNGVSKFEYMKSVNDYSPESAIVFENEVFSIREAVRSGIPAENIFQIQ